MSQHDDFIYIQNMIKLSNEAMELVLDLDIKSLKINRVLQLALSKLLENIGEASINVSEELKTKYPNVPWEEMRGMRNRIAHGYNKINIDIIYQTCKKDLVILVSELNKINE